MSRTKQWILIVLVVVAVIQAGLGGLQDMFGTRLFGVSAQHGWHDSIILLLLAILVVLTMK